MGVGGEAAAFPRLLPNRAGAGEERVEPSCVAPQAPFLCLPAPAWGLMLFSVARLQPWLTGPRLFMPFALIMWAGLSAGRVAAILRVAK